MAAVLGEMSQPPSSGWSGAPYQHALFHRWDPAVAASLLKDITELGLQDTNNTAMGLYYFLRSRATGYVPATIAPLLDDFVSLLDPAMSSPDAEVALWGATVTLGELDTRFSRSVREGLNFLVKGRAVSQTEREFLDRLAQLDELLSTPRLRRRRPTAATRIQRLIRDFSCRIARRSIGARHAIVPDATTLDAFQRVVEDDGELGHELREIANQVEDLLNNHHNFDVSLTTTFGQPLPPVRSRATLVVPRRRVYPKDVRREGRPRQSVCFLNVEVGRDPQPIALTYDLFKAVSDLDRGLSQASLPRSVLALLDTTRARMAGSIVRDRNVTERPTIFWVRIWPSKGVGDDSPRQSAGTMGTIGSSRTGQTRLAGSCPGAASSKIPARQRATSSRRQISSQPARAWPG